MTQPSSVHRSFQRLSTLALFLAFLVPVCTVACSLCLFLGRIPVREIFSPMHLAEVAGLAVVGLTAFVVLLRLWRRFAPDLDVLCDEQSSFLDGWSGARSNAAIFAAAGLSLLLELAVIRWQTTVFEFFALYKNIGLLACFAGLGLGYALASKPSLPLVLVLPMLLLQVVLLECLKFGLPDWLGQSLKATPVSEQINLGFAVAHSAAQYLAVYLFLAAVFLLTALAFVPVGQLCGRLMDNSGRLRAYGWNLLGSFVGVLAMLVLSYLWTPPAVWFALCVALLLPFVAYRRRALLITGFSGVLLLASLSWPVGFLHERIYSPYQLIERGQNDLGYMTIRAAGLYYQRVYDLALNNPNRTANANLHAAAQYYELPYHLHPGAAKVAVVGAGTGNDVAAALRMGAASVDAIEIDPAILALGQAYHPEHPYSDPRVHAILNDARTYLRNTTEQYDLIVYGLLDSHALLSQASNVRIDSFVYTLEAFQEAARRLRPGGMLVVSFSAIQDAIAGKFYLMLREAFGGVAPVCLYSGYDGAVVFVQGRDGRLDIAPEVLAESACQDRTERYASPALAASMSTDDWPFVYMPRRVYPVTYMVMALVVVALTVLLAGGFLAERPRFGYATFFFLGAGFMLVETKGITELGLTFGNTWQVIGVVISGILLMAFLANCLVAWLRPQRILPAVVLLLATLALGYWVAGHGGFPSTFWGRAGALVLLTSPLFFSGWIFSSMLRGAPSISAAMATNMVGVIAGGLLEYNSMYFGFRFLYLLAMALYVCALVFWPRNFAKTNLQTAPQ